MAMNNSLILLLILAAFINIGQPIRTIRSEAGIDIPLREVRSEDVEPVASWTFTPENGGKDLSPFGENPITLTKMQYGPGPDGEENGAIIFPEPHEYEQSMIVMNPTERLQLKTELTYFTQIFLSGNYTPVYSLIGGTLFEYSPVLEGPMSGVSRGVVIAIDDTNVWMTTFRMDIGGWADNIMELDKWNKVAIVWTLYNMKLYVNGERKVADVVRIPYESVKNEGHIHIGRCAGSDCVGYLLPGRMACAQFYNRALSQQEVAALTCD